MRHEEALLSYERAITFRPAFAQAHYNRGNALGALHRHAQALESYERAIALQPDYADAHVKRGVALRDLKRHAEALESYERALRINPGLDWLYGAWLNARMQICDWTDFATNRDGLTRQNRAAGKGRQPLSGSRVIGLAFDTENGGGNLGGGKTCLRSCASRDCGTPPARQDTHRVFFGRLLRACHFIPDGRAARATRQVVVPGDGIFVRPRHSRRR